MLRLQECDSVLSNVRFFEGFISIGDEVFSAVIKEERQVKRYAYTISVKNDVNETYRTVYEFTENHCAEISHLKSISEDLIMILYKNLISNKRRIK